MICTKTAYRDLGMIHWLRVKQRKDRKPRTGPMKIPYWCKNCQAYHLRKVAILLLSILSAVHYEIQKDHRNMSKMLPCENAAIETEGQFSLPMSGLREQTDIGLQAQNRTLVENKAKSETPSKSRSERSGDERQDSKTNSVREMRDGSSLSSYSRASSGLREKIRGGLVMSQVPPKRTFIFYRVKESKHYDPEQGLIPTKFYGRLC